MSKKEVLLTYEGLKKLEQELEFLKGENRKEIADRIKTALAFGDISENSEYDEAKLEQAQNEKRISVLENMLKSATIIDEDDVDTEVVSLGAKVKILNIKDNEEYDYKIVGSAEANPIAGKISNESPVGEAILGAREGDEVVIDAPGGKIKYKILSIYK